jgi:5-methylcytosine-specific restriction protein A
MDRPLRFCVEPGCDRRVRSGRCDQHVRPRQERSRSNRDVRKWYHVERWARLRRLVLIEAAYQCAYCGRVALALHVDHIVPHRGDLGLFWDVSNLQALCPACHQAKTMDGD